MVRGLREAKENKVKFFPEYPTLNLGTHIFLVSQVKKKRKANRVCLVSDLNGQVLTNFPYF